MPITIISVLMNLMKTPSESWVGNRNTLIVDEISPIQESCTDCEVANSQYITALQLQELTEYVYDIVAGHKTSRDILEILEPNENLDATFKEWLHEFFPGIGAMEKPTIDSLRFINDLSEETAEWFIKHANRKIMNYETLVGSCAGKGLKKIALHKSKKQAIVELTICNGEVAIARDSKKSASHTMTVTAQKLEPKE